MRAHTGASGAQRDTHGLRALTLLDARCKNPRRFLSAALFPSNSNVQYLLRYFSFSSTISFETCSNWVLNLPQTMKKETTKYSWTLDPVLLVHFSNFPAGPLGGSRRSG